MNESIAIAAFASGAVVALFIGAGYWCIMVYKALVVKK